jgi:hypothetical protein
MPLFTSPGIAWANQSALPVCLCMRLARSGPPRRPLAIDALPRFSTPAILPITTPARLHLCCCTRRPCCRTQGCRLGNTAANPLIWLYCLRNSRVDSARRLMAAPPLPNDDASSSCCRFTEIPSFSTPSRSLAGPPCLNAQSEIRMFCCMQNLKSCELCAAGHGELPGHAGLAATL